MKNKLLGTALLALALSLSTSLPAVADQTEAAYNNTFRIGVYSIFYHDHADNLSGPYVPAGTNIVVQNVDTLYLAYTRRLPYNFGIEFAFGWPPLTKTEGKGTPSLGSVPYNGQVISTARWISPTLLLTYTLFSEDTRVRPYIEAGVNYTTFYDRKNTAAGNAASGGPTRLSLTSSVGPAGTVGVDVRITRRFHMYASYSVTQVKSDLTADTDGVIRRTRINFGPQALVVAGGVAF